MSDIQVRSVLTKRDERAFIRLPWKIYAKDPVWVPPLLMDRKKLIDKKRNPFYRHARMQLFLADHEGETVGRIGAIVNDNHNIEHKENIGFFGFFECVNDQEVANALFDAASDWLRRAGVSAMCGPASPSVNDEYGLLVDGFERPPAILMAYNPPYYQTLCEQYGLRKAKDMYAYYLEQNEVFSERFVRVSELAKKREGLEFRSLNMKDFDREVKTIRDLYNKAWASNWGEVPMTEEEFNYAAKDLKPIVDPDLVIIAESKGVPVGFALSLPDLNVILKRNRSGRLLPFLFRYLLFKKKIDFIRIVILGVLPQYLNSGIGAVLFYETGRRAVQKGYYHGEASWVLEDNVMMNRGAELLSGRRYKTYRIYEKPLT